MKNPATNTDLIYYWSDPFSSWVITTLDQLRQQETIDNAFYNCTTWDELEKSIDSDNFNFLYNLYCDNHEIENELDKNSEIDWEAFEDIYPSTFPTPLIYLIEEIIPVELLQKHSNEVLTMHDGSYYQISEENIKQLINELSKAGYTLDFYEDEIIFL
jgi:hypothetical protein